MQTLTEIHPRTGGLRLALPAPYTIRHSESHYDTIREALLKHSEVTLDLPAEADADLSFLQLVEVARLYAATMDKHLSLEKPASALVREKLKVAGLVSKEDRVSNLFWFHEEVCQ